MTTNFDSLIERAYFTGSTRHPILQICFEDAVAKDGRMISFRQFAQAGFPERALLKLHGSLRGLHRPVRHALPNFDLDALPSVAATLDSIGAQSESPELEPFKLRALEHSVRDRFVCVMGYSGSDDFDITPALALTIEAAAGLIWIKHEPRVPILIGDLHQGRFVRDLPAELRGHLPRGPALVVKGDSTEIVSQLFGPSRWSLLPRLNNQGNTQIVQTILSNYHPYAA